MSGWTVKGALEWGRHDREMCTSREIKSAMESQKPNVEHPRTDSEREGDGDAGGDEMKDPLNLLREAFDIYDSKKAPWEQSKEYFEKLKEFCDYSEKWRKEQEKTITRPHNRDAGETRMGTTEWDVFHELSAKRLKKNGIHL